MSINEQIDLNNLLHPSAAYSHPSEVLKDNDLTGDEKRSVLAAWASDVLSVEGLSTLRRGRQRSVLFDDIIEAFDCSTSNPADIGTPYVGRFARGS